MRSVVIGPAAKSERNKQGAIAEVPQPRLRRSGSRHRRGNVPGIRWGSGDRPFRPAEEKLDPQRNSQETKNDDNRGGFRIINTKLFQLQLGQISVRPGIRKGPIQRQSYHRGCKRQSCFVVLILDRIHFRLRVASTSITSSCQAYQQRRNTGGVAVFNEKLYRRTGGILG